ncbi:MAG TPA: c-type cytochrome [Chloroflexota bacterium]
MATDPEPASQSLATQQPAPLAPSDVVLTGGAGLFDHSQRDAVGRSPSAILGMLGLVAAAAITVVLVMLNPSLAGGKAGGTPNQLLPAGAAAGGGGAAAGGEAAEGAQIIATKPCVGCHTIPGIPGANGQVGPNLAGVASRTKIAGGAVSNAGPDDLKKWILNPPAVKPGTGMPNVGLTDDEATKIVAFLETLK